MPLVTSLFQAKIYRCQLSAASLGSLLPSCIVNIVDGVVSGQFPRRALSHVLEWHQQHRDELMLDWEKARRHEPLSPIAPLE